MMSRIKECSLSSDNYCLKKREREREKESYKTCLCTFATLPRNSHRKKISIYSSNSA